jgi:hypothetical protein
VTSHLSERDSELFAGFDMTNGVRSGGDAKRFPIRFDKWYGVLSSMLFLSPASSYVEVDSHQVCVHMSWAFRSCFPRGAVVSVVESYNCPLSRGVHGFAGRWLINGSGQGMLTLDLRPNQRGYVMGFPVRLQQLMVSVTEPEALAAVLRNPVSKDGHV